MSGSPRCYAPGTPEGLARHKVLHSTRCEPCMALSLSQRPQGRCCPFPGTAKGRALHRKHHQRLCPECAKWLASRSRSPASGTAPRLTPTEMDKARRRAMSRLRERFPDLYRLFVQVEYAKARARLGKPQDQAFMRKLEKLLRAAGCVRDEKGNWVDAA